MTSKNSFFRKMKQDLEQRVWFPVLFFIISFLFLEIFLISEFNIYANRENARNRMLSFLLDTFFNPAGVFSVVTVGSAVVSGISGFAYMHSARKLDVYHSIPVKREKLFFGQYCYGILYYAVPLLIHILICLVICAGKGMLDSTVAAAAFWFLLVQVLFYLACYVAVLTVVTLTGNTIISVLGSGVLLGYTGLLELLRISLMDSFFATYYGTEPQSGIPALTPIHLIVKLADSMSDSSTGHLLYSQQLWFCGKLLLMAAVYTASALYFYRKRPTEAAGRTLVFSVSEPIIKFLIVLPVTLFSGYFFADVGAVSNDFSWFVFGCVFAFCISNPLLEIIFRKDVKAGLCHSWQMVINGSAVVLTVLILHVDALGYDTALPRESQVESYAFAFDQMNTVSAYYGNEYEKKLDQMQILGNESVRGLLEHAASVTRPVRKGEIEPLDDAAYYSLTVKYHLVNGKARYRNYVINLSDPQVQSWVAAIFENMEYKKVTYPILDEDWEENCIALLVDDGYSPEDYELITLPEDDMQRLLTTYRKELTELTFKEVLTELPVARLGFQRSGTWEERQNMKFLKEETGYEIYPSFTETIALLKQYGVEIPRELTSEEVISLTVYDDTYERLDQNGLLDKEIQLEYTAADGEQAEIGQLLPYMVPYSLAEGIHSKNMEDYVRIRAVYQYNGQETSRYFRLYRGRVPDFLTEDIAQVAAELAQ